MSEQEKEPLESDTDFATRIAVAAGSISNSERFVLRTSRGHDLDVLGHRHGIVRKGREIHDPDKEAAAEQADVEHEHAEEHEHEGET